MGLKARTLSFVLLLLVVAGCGLDPEELRSTLETRAVSTVSSHLDVSGARPVTLRAAANPWGSGFLVFTSDATNREGLWIWWYNADLGWSFPPRPKRDKAFAFDAQTSKLTPRLPRFDTANPELRRHAGLNDVSPDDVYKVVLYSIKHDTHLYVAREAISGRSPVGPGAPIPGASAGR